MDFYGSYERKHILLGTHTGKPLLGAKSCSEHLLRPFQSIIRLRLFLARPAGGLQNIPVEKAHVPSKLLLLWQALFNVEEIRCLNRKWQVK